MQLVVARSFLLVASLCPVCRAGCVGNACSPGTQPFSKGSVCAGREQQPASTALVGRHLRLLEYEWPPYASRDLKDPALLTGWKGYDIDLLDYIAQKAGFTYEIAQVEELDFSPQGYANLAPNEQLERGLQFGDAMLSYWSRTTARCNHPNYTMLYGHLDSSKALIARQIPTPVVPLEARLLSFMRPFKYELWACLFLMVLASGVVDYLLENRRGPRSGDAEAAPEARRGRVTESIYEYAAGTLWGGFQTPKTKPSAMYQVVLGILLLVSLSTYTANVAAFMTVSAQPTLTVSSVDEAILHKKKICTDSNTEHPSLGAARRQLEALYPRLEYSYIESTAEAGRQVASGACDGLIVGLQQFDAWKMQSEFCSLEVAQVLFPARAGWVVSHSDACVAHTFEWALHEAEATGVIERAKRKWFPRSLGECPPSTSSGGSGGSGAGSSGGDSGASSGANGGSSSGSSSSGGAARRRRQLQAAGGSLLAVNGSTLSGMGAAPASVSASLAASGVSQMELLDFSGVFLAWCVATFACLLWNEAQNRRWLARLREACVGTRGRKGGADERAAGSSGDAGPLPPQPEPSNTVLSQQLAELRDMMVVLQSGHNYEYSSSEWRQDGRRDGVGGDGGSPEPLAASTSPPVWACTAAPPPPSFARTVLRSPTGLDSMRTAAASRSTARRV